MINLLSVLDMTDALYFIKRGALCETPSANLLLDLINTGHMVLMTKVNAPAIGYSSAPSEQFGELLPMLAYRMDSAPLAHKEVLMAVEERPENSMKYDMIAVIITSSKMTRSIATRMIPMTTGKHCGIDQHAKGHEEYGDESVPERRHHFFHLQGHLGPANIIPMMKAPIMLGIPQGCLSPPICTPLQG